MGSRRLQLRSELHGKLVAWHDLDAKLEVAGDFDGCEVAAAPVIDTSFVVARIAYVRARYRESWEDAGALLFDVEGTARVGVWVHLEELAVGEPDVVWRAAPKLVPHVDELRIA